MQLIKTKRIITLILVLSIFIIVFSACGQDGVVQGNRDESSQKSSDGEDSSSLKSDDADGVNYLNVGEFPLVTEPKTLTIMVNNSPTQNDFNEVAMWNAYQEMTGVNIIWENIPAGTADEKLTTSFASGDLPDVFLKFSISATNQMKFGSEGMLVNLNEGDLLKKYAPNFYDYMKANPSVESALTMPDGAIYSFPQALESIPNRVASKMFINKEWLDKCGLDLPTNTDEFYNMLVRFKEDDPNGNGINDEIPYTAPNFNYMYYNLAGAFGVGNRGVHDTLVDADPETGYPRITATSDEWKNLLKYLNRLYSEGLIDNDIFNMKEEQYTTKVGENLAGVISYTNFSNIPNEAAKNFVGLEEALEGPDGHKFWFPIRSNLHSIGNWVITSECETPELAVSFVDYFYTEEGSLLYNYGVEGESHVVNPDGTYSFVDSVYEAIEDGITFDAAVAPHVTVGGGNPILLIEKYFYGGETDPVPAAAAHAVMEYAPEEIWPIFNYTQSEADEASVIRTDIANYINKMRAEFITGKTSFDKWDAYKEQIEKMGADRLCEIVNDAYERTK